MLSKFDAAVTDVKLLLFKDNNSPQPWNLKTRAYGPERSIKGLNEILGFLSRRERFLLCSTFNKKTKDVQLLSTVMFSLFNNQILN